MFDFPLFRVPMSGGVPEDLHQPGRSPQVLPGGAVLFTQLNAAPDLTHHVMALLPDGSVKELVRNAMNPRYVAPGYLIYAERSTLIATKFDARRVEVIGSPVAVVEDVQGSGIGWSAFSASANGSLAYVPGSMMAPTGRALVWIDRADGHETPWPFPVRSYGPALPSPDSSPFLATMVDPSGKPPGPNQPPNPRVLVVGDFARRTLTALTDVPTPAFAWMGGARAIYVKPDGSLFWRRVDFSRPEEMLRPPGSIAVIGLSPDQMAMAPDNRSIVWAGRDPATPNGPVSRCGRSSDRERTSLWPATF